MLPLLRIVAGEKVPELQQIGIAIVNGKETVNETALLHALPNDLGIVLELPRIVEEMVLGHPWIEAEMFLDPGKDLDHDPIEIFPEPEMNPRDLHKIEIDLVVGDMKITIGIDQSPDHLEMYVPYPCLHPAREIIARTAEEMIVLNPAEDIAPMKMKDTGLLGICLAHLPEEILCEIHDHDLAVEMFILICMIDLVYPERNPFPGSWILY